MVVEAMCTCYWQALQVWKHSASMTTNVSNGKSLLQLLWSWNLPQKMQQYWRFSLLVVEDVHPHFLQNPAYLDHSATTMVEISLLQLPWSWEKYHNSRKYHPPPSFRSHLSSSPMGVSKTNTRFQQRWMLEISRRIVTRNSHY